MAETSKLNSETGKLNSETQKLNSEAQKLNREALKLSRETFWYPVAIGGGLVGAVAAITATMLKILS
ncbi:hypothetical protein CQW29_20745 [Pantoea coffeiphila]|uniref:Uncharacterized protein n=1 Tax=Pantoea coffeiphila TaxID=1465635 RepID=A0A2S9I7B2_9GAMM|nr:hypothetical protein CQW29_20745 [Pantoea coffeiphila]